MRIGKKNIIKKHLVPMAAFGHDLVHLVECCHRVGEGDLKLLHEAEVTGSHFPAVGLSLAANGPALSSQRMPERVVLWANFGH